jgi:hypothetical protein
MSKIRTGIKMRVNPEQSQKVQEICFENGVGWKSGRNLEYLDEPYLFIDDTISFMYEVEEGDFLNDLNEEVSAELFIKTNGTCIESEVPTESTPSEEPQPKPLSEYLKENNAYESFVENCVERALGHPLSFECKRGEAEDIDDFFIWDKTKEGHDYWENLQSNIPKPIEYDMNEIIFAEVDKRIAEQTLQPEFISTEEFDQIFQENSSTKYMVFVEDKNTPRCIHDCIASAEKEAKRLSAKEIGCNVFVVEIIREFKSKIVVEEI